MKVSTWDFKISVSTPWQKYNSFHNSQAILIKNTAPFTMIVLYKMTYASKWRSSKKIALAIVRFTSTQFTQNAFSVDFSVNISLERSWN